MTALVNDLLEASLAGRGGFQVSLAPIDLVPLVREAVARQVAAVEESGRHGFAVATPDALVVRGDAGRIEQLLGDLIGNAVKYSPAGGEISVTLARGADIAEILIRDPGIGITAEDLPRIGRAFVRGTGRAGTFAGMGIGLYVSRLVAEGHGGTLDIESAGDGAGTTVRVRLPVTT